MRIRVGLVMLWAASCGGMEETHVNLSVATSATVPEANPVEGRRVWFEATFGGEVFFSFILPRPPFDLPLGLDVVLTSDRRTRFDRFGVINDPDCVQGDASTGGLDRCADPRSSGIVGVRRFRTLSGGSLFGVACAACHAGFDPTRPPADPNAPAWADIHPTVGNQYLDIGLIFRLHLAPGDPRHQVFRSWARGTVNTTAIENDHINNPGAITPIWNVPDRPFFDHTLAGAPVRVHRSGQGGEDDAGCERAALRVYFNIGMCAAECMLPHLANGPGGTQTPIDLDECRARCPRLREAEAAVPGLCAFLDTVRAPRLVDAPGGAAHVDWAAVPRGARVFAAACASCHGGPARSDDRIHPARLIGTNVCRSLTTNWTAENLWAQFSSDQYKARPTGGPGFHRDMPLVGLWATAPFLHNNRLGLFNGDPSVAGRIAAYEDAMRQLLSPWRRDLIGSIQRTDAPVTVRGLTLPTGTPIALFASFDPQTGANLCPDLFENQGHYFGWALPAADKHALIEYLKLQ